jgi:hypothetical protein
MRARKLGVALPLALLLPLLLLAASRPALAAVPLLDRGFCDGLSDGESRQQCAAYVDAADATSKWTVAVRWARFYRGSCE